METEDLDKILNKPYSELNAAERETIQEICSSEEEFVQLQQFFASVESYARETQDNSMPAPETKDRLDDLFHQTYQSKGILWYNSLWISLYPAEKRFDQRPLVRIAAILVVLLSIVPFLDRPKNEKGAMLAKTETVKKEKTETEAAQSTVQADQLSDETVSLNKSPKAKAHVTVSSKMTAVFDQVSEGKVSTASDAFSVGAVTYTFAAPPSVSGFVHPDGIYMDKDYHQNEFKVSENLAVLDLLTPTF